MAQLLLCTRNKGKLQELQTLLAPLAFNVQSVSERYPTLPDPEETGETFEENAQLKVNAYPLHANQWLLADDSGLEIEALDGAPGVRSARFAGPGATDLQLCEEVLACMAGNANRRAQFVCVIALKSNSDTHLFKGIVTGHLTTQIQGSGGFGYDPIFVPDGYVQTFAELGTDIKNSFSHRGRALGNMIDYLKRTV